MILTEERSPFIVEWFDSCQKYGLIPSPINTKEKLEEISNTLNVFNGISNSNNNWWQIGLNFTNGRCIWSNNQPYVPEIHDQLFHEEFRPNCQLPNGFAYLKLSSK